MILNHYLEIYKPNFSTNVYSVPHFYRLASKCGNDTNVYLPIWNADKKKVLKRLTTVVEYLDNEFLFAVAPSRTTLFVNDIRQAIAAAFPNSRDMSDCFKKIRGFDAGVATRLLTDTELRQEFTVSPNCLEKFNFSNAGQILLLDDVYSIGNTFSGMILALRDNGVKSEIITAALLKTEKDAV